jgi:pimeloyl-ACP methyl ester carboxylesterase
LTVGVPELHHQRVKSPLVLIPGLLCDATVWGAQRQALDDLVEVHVAANGMLDSLPAMAQAILAWAPERFALAGHSMGGRIALEVVRRAPQRVSALALLDTGYQPLAAGEVGERERSGRLALLERARKAGMRAMGEEWLRGMIHPARLEDGPLIDQILTMIASKTPQLYEAQIHALLGRPDATSLLAQIRCRTLILCGREDGWSPPRRHQEMAALIPGSALEIVADCGHMCTLEQPDAVSRALRGWLEQHEASA